jgi:DNA-binding NarL/FixJ family response regulator
VTEAIRVLVVDDQDLLRGSFRLLIDTAPDMVAIGEAGTGVEAVELACRERPDVVLMDVRMPRMDGIEATRRICGSPDTARVRVLILTTFDSASAASNARPRRARLRESGTPRADRRAGLYQRSRPRARRSRPRQ